MAKASASQADSSSSSSQKRAAKRAKSSVSYPAETARRSLLHESKRLSDSSAYRETLFVTDRDDVAEIEEIMGEFEKSGSLSVVRQTFRAVVMAAVSKKTLTASNIADLVLKDKDWLPPKLYGKGRNSGKFWSWLYDHVNYEAEMVLACGVALRLDNQAVFPRKAAWILVNRPLPDKHPYSTFNYDTNSLMNNVSNLSSASARGVLIVALAVLMMRRSTSKDGVAYSELLEDVTRVEKAMSSASHVRDPNVDVESTLKSLVAQKYLKRVNTKRKDPETGEVIWAYECGERSLVEIDQRDVLRFITMTLDIEFLEDDVMDQYLAVS